MPALHDNGVTVT